MTFHQLSIYIHPPLTRFVLLSKLMRGQRLAKTIKSTTFAESFPKIFNVDRKGKRRPIGKIRAEDTRRVDIIDQQLCGIITPSIQQANLILTITLPDDVIGYLAPTLEQHKGCTVLDFDPGPCLFSSKLHDFLKPKKHVLLEPDARYFEPYIAPLLAQSNSTYQHVNFAGPVHNIFSWPHEVRVKLDPNLLPDRTPVTPDDPRSLRYDPSLLILGNIGHRLKIGKKNPVFQEFQRMVLFNLGRSVLSRSGVFESGLVRTLWWVTDAYKNSILAGNVPDNRTAVGMHTDLGFHTNEVVGVRTLQEFQERRVKQRRRLEGLDRMADAATDARMKENKMRVPEGRTLQPVASHDSKGKKTPANLSPFANIRDNVEDLDADITAASSRLAYVHKWASRRVVAPTRDKELIEESIRTIRYPQATTMRKENTVRRDLSGETEWRGSRKTVFLDLGLRILNLEASYQNIHDRDPSNPALPALKTRILDLDKSLFATIRQAGEITAKDCDELIEDQIIAYSTPPLLNYDQRSYRPLKTSADCFYPNVTPLALIDFVPRGIDIGVPDLANPFDSAKIISYLIHGMMRTRRQPMPVALERLAVNAAKDLIPMVPAITDVRRGGRLDPMKVTVRSVSVEMLAGLVRAWFEWPFRPAHYKLALAEEDEPEVEEQEEQEEEAV